MAVQAKDFTFDGISLTTFNKDYELVSFDTSPSDTSVEFMDNKVEMSDANYNSPTVHYYYSAAKDTLEFDIMIANRRGEYLTQQEIIDLSSWLTNSTEPKVLYFTEYTNDSDNAVYKNIEYIGVFNKAKYSEMGQSRKMGIGFTFTCISSYGFTRPFTTRINNSTGGIKTTSIINTGTNTGLYIYPIFEITPMETGTVYISNLSDTANGEFGINVTNGEKIIIKEFNVYDSRGDFYSFDKLTSLHFPRFVDGENLIKINGKCICDITYRFYMNVGV